MVVARAVGLVEATGRRHGIEFPVQMTLTTTDGETTWTFRYSTEGRSRTLYHSTDVATLRQQYSTIRRCTSCPTTQRLVVSEPLGNLRGAWRDVPESWFVAVHGGTEKMLPFAPVGPEAAA